MSEYPDHLNPFKEKKRIGKSLTKSFREIKGFIRQSFRRKKTDGKNHQEDFDTVEIRRPLNSNSYCNTMRNNVMSAPQLPSYNYYTLTSPPLPRSRFKERLSRSSLNNAADYDEKFNPFAELNPFDQPPVPYRRRKSKKRAPLPPSCSNPDMNLDCSLRGSSKWSLTSSETDCTIDDRSECSGEFYCSESLRECLDNFNKEMDTLNKESLEIEKSFQEIVEDEKDISHSVEEFDREINNNQEDIDTKSTTEKDDENIEYMDDSSRVEIDVDSPKRTIETNDYDVEERNCKNERMAKIEEETIVEKTEDIVENTQMESNKPSENNLIREDGTEIKEQIHEPNSEILPSENTER